MHEERLRTRLVELSKQQEAIVKLCSDEKRDPTDEERAQLDQLQSEFDQTDADLKRVEKLNKQNGRLNESVGRKSEPAQPTTGQLANAAYDGVAGDGQTVAATAKPKNGGYDSLGQFALDVRRACAAGGAVSEKLYALAPTTYGSEGVGADGGFPVPDDFRDTIMQKVLAEDSLAARCDQIPTSSRVLVTPQDDVTPWDSSNGIQAYWEGEADQLTQSKPKLGKLQTHVSKITALVPMTEELLEDAPAMDAWLRRKAPEKIDYKLNEAIIRGTGAGMPLGILNSNALLSVAKVGSQVADTIVGQNIIDMYTRMYARCRPSSVWLANQEVEPQLLTLQKQGKLDTGATDTGWGVPLYLPANGISGAPFATLFGRPIFLTQAASQLGDQGDIILADLSKYLLPIRSGINPRVDVSIHLWFDYDTAAYRFILRIGGQPEWSSVIQPRVGNHTLSCFVTLDERA